MTRRKATMSRIAVGLTLVLLVILCQATQAQKPCCPRNVAVMPVPMPEIQSLNYSSILQGAITSPLSNDALEGDDIFCPVWIQLVTHTYSAREYAFIGELTPTRVYRGEDSEIGPEDNPSGQQITAEWNLKVRLVELYHGTVLKEAEADWIGYIYEYERRDYDKSFLFNRITEAVQTFLPLKELIYDYERTPDTCAMKPQKDSVEASEKITIEVQGFVDSRKRPSPRFQRIMVHAKEGTIVNGIEQWDRKVFEIGEGGVVTVEYRAPENCDFPTDTLIVENSCYFNRPIDWMIPGEEISRQPLKIYDRMPARCEIIPERPVVEAGSAINVTITGIVDNMNKPLQPEERLMVKAGTGKITNGMSYGAYRIFEVGDGTINARYRAENDCRIIADTIEVYSCCLQGEDTYEFIPQELIRRKKVGVKCEYEWIGTLTFNQSSDFSCDIDSTKEPRRIYLTAAESQMQLGSFSIVTDKIDLERQGTAILTPDRMKASGYVNCSKDITRENGGSSSTTGDWEKEKETLTASKHCRLTEDNLRISMGKDVTGMESAVEQLSQELLAAARAGDVERVEDIKSRMTDAVHGGNKDSNQLSIQVQIGIDCMALAQKTHIQQQYDSGKDEMSMDRSSNTAEETRIGTPIALNLDGTFTKGENGEGTITGSYSKSGTTDAGMGLGNIKCPPISSSVSCHLTLEKRRK